MDPSYNNSFGSFQNSAGGVISSVPSAAPEERKMRKGPIIAGIVFVLVALVAVVWYLVTGGVGTSKLEKKAPEFYDLMTFLEDGEGFEPGAADREGEEGQNEEETTEASENDWIIENDGEECEEGEEDCVEEGNYNELVFAVRVGMLVSADQIDDYYNDVKEKLRGFEEARGGAVSEEALTEYKRVLGLVDGAINYEAMNEKLLTAYLRGGAEAVRQELVINLDCNGEDLKEICEAERKYYEVKIAEYDFYGGAGCLNVGTGDEELDDYYDEGCMAQVYGDGYEDIYTEFIGNNDEMEYFDVFHSYAGLKQLSDAVQQSNGLLAKELENV